MDVEERRRTMDDGVNTLLASKGIDLSVDFGEEAQPCP